MRFKIPAGWQLLAMGDFVEETPYQFAPEPGRFRLYRGWYGDHYEYYLVRGDGPAVEPGDIWPIADFQVAEIIGPLDVRFLALDELELPPQIFSRPELNPES